LIKKLKVFLRVQKSLKMTKNHFGQKLENEAFFSKTLFDLKALLFKRNPKQDLIQFRRL
jgi:hypothetical protein